MTGSVRRLGRSPARRAGRRTPAAPHDLAGAEREGGGMTTRVGHFQPGDGGSKPNRS